MIFNVEQLADDLFLLIRSSLLWVLLYKYIN